MGLVWLKFAVVPLSVVLKPILLVLKQRSYTNILGPYLKLYNYDIIKVKTRGVVLEPILLVL